ncbi:SAM-dependent methyltransferase [Thermocatellispora tengchongensis]|uniref:SAM-dependent methyltransferase n=1 Tax=Thermocatellispora tengchongensis TaxID=1073253 RepID=A0A840NSD6_9ACTN|nr:class I SAM-dependent methyltransferase [Thermocatellispora tengchongensis]MBB5130488.1 SAM-dependent methyltransferase [Thermocatellispora tengchongensis]
MSEICWIEDGEARSARWRSANGSAPPGRVVVADDRISADRAYRFVREGVALLWRGDYHNARLLLSAVARRVERRSRGGDVRALPGAFHAQREARSRQATLLGRLLVPLDQDYSVPLRRAPDVRVACAEVYGPAAGPSVVSLRELLGIVGAHEWRRKGVEVPALGGRIHPHYGVFSPVRGEYVDLVARAPLVSRSRAFDIGTGTGVLAAVLARRGVERVVATDRDPRAVACARDNLRRLGLAERVEVMRVDVFPPGRAPLVVCNPPWIPAEPVSPLDHAVYDPGGRMLRGFLDGLSAHLEPDGEGWLILSDLAERLMLRTRAELLAGFAAAGLRVLGRLETRARHPRAREETDALHAARAAEVTSLWRLGRV